MYTFLFNKNKTMLLQPTQEQKIEQLIRKTLRQNYLIQNGDHNALNKLHKRLYKSINCCNVPKNASRV